MWEGIWSLMLSRTTLPNRRCRTPSSMVSSRSSASSSLMAMSASRVTWNGCASMTSMPGKSVARLAAITCSIQTKASSRAMRLPAFLRGRVTGTSCGSVSGTLMRAKCSTPWVSRISTARFRLRLEMWGKGRPGSKASGVSTGKMVSAK